MEWFLSRLLWSEECLHAGFQFRIGKGFEQNLMGTSLQGCVP